MKLRFNHHGSRKKCSCCLLRYENDMITLQEMSQSELLISIAAFALLVPNAPREQLDTRFPNAPSWVQKRCMWLKSWPFFAMEKWRCNVGNLQVIRSPIWGVLWGLLDRLWGCMLATYRSLQVLWGLLDRRLGPCWGLLDRLWGCMLATYRSLQVLGPMGPVRGCMLATYRSLQVLWGLLDRRLGLCWGLLDRLWGCMLATRSYGACSGLYVGNLQVITGPMRPVGPPFGAVLRPVGPPLGLYVGNLQVITGPMGPVRGCMLATYRSLQVLWPVGPPFGAVLRPVGPPLGLYVGNLQVITGPMGPVRGCMLATYRSLQVLWGLLDRRLGLCWGLLDRLWGCMLATYRSLQVLWGLFGAVCWQPTGHYRSYGACSGLYVGNLQVITGPMRPVGPPLGLCACNLQVITGPMRPVGPLLGQPTGSTMPFGPRLAAINFKVALFSAVSNLFLYMLAVGASNLFSGYINPKLRKISWSSCAIIYHTVW